MTYLLYKRLWVPLGVNLSPLWNFGFLLGVLYVLQLITGVFLSFYYSGSVDGAFDSVMFITDYVKGGSIVRSMHANGASFMFMGMYVHMARAIYYGGYAAGWVWLSGLCIFYLMMAISFMGYVLPWGQMSFWAGQVVLNLVTSVPYVGSALYKCLMCGEMMNDLALSRINAMHYLVPFFLGIVLLVHVSLLHTCGSSNPVTPGYSSYRVALHKLFTAKDLGFLWLLVLPMGAVVLYFPWAFMEKTNFVEADSMVTPLHIVPEWYFLFAYHILRSIDFSKTLGVALMFSALLVPAYLAFAPKGKDGMSLNLAHYPFTRAAFFIWALNFVLLSYCGTLETSDSVVLFGKVATAIYFFFFFFMHPMMKWEIWFSEMLASLKEFKEPWRAVVMFMAPWLCVKVVVLGFVFFYLALGFVF